MQLLKLYHALQLNGMLMMRKILQAMQDDAIRATTIHPTFILVTGLTFSYGKISSPLTEISGWKNAISCVFRRKFCAVISCLFYWFYPSVVLLVRSSVRKKGSETVTPLRMLQGRDVYPSDRQTPLQLLLVCFFLQVSAVRTRRGMCAYGPSFVRKRSVWWLTWRRYIEKPRGFCAIQNSGLNNSIWVKFGCRARIYLPTLKENVDLLAS